MHTTLMTHDHLSCELLNNCNGLAFEPKELTFRSSATTGASHHRDCPNYNTLDSQIAACQGLRPPREASLTLRHPPAAYNHHCRLERKDLLLYLRLLGIVGQSLRITVHVYTITVKSEAPKRACSHRKAHAIGVYVQQAARRKMHKIKDTDVGKFY